MVELEIVLDHTEHSLLEVKLSQIYQKQLLLFFFFHAAEWKLLRTLQALIHYKVLFDSGRLE